MNKTNLVLGIIILILILALAAVLTYRKGDPGPEQINPDSPFYIPSQTIAYSLYSGTHSNNGAQTILAFEHTISHPGANSLRLIFDDADLGQGSHITVTSLHDNNEQVIDFGTLKLWKGTSAYFNGDSVVVKLFVAPGDSGVSFKVKEIIVG